ncbi:hypothetical protein GCM10007304_29020 [Rhodococcoides trifolii]|uniref:Primosomal protein n=1 Tax=Rhodococcoides trifolii TaxID=908250 RepID=A0A917FXZ8_9NOCA|nr:primosomal protein [Rhodococcus trifolii]GGG13233.1 hypothetical protein GCM10007304_29020 [Rhodococcus trifolii]
MAGDIVPIELGVTAGDLVTLWAPEWREGDEEWEAFLGHDEEFHAFPTVAELAGFVRTDTENDLVDHPSWRVLVALSAAQLEPDDDHRYDFVGVPELAAGSPTYETVSELGETLEMARTIGEVCELDAVTRFFNSNPVLGVLGRGADTFTGRDGKQLWDRVGAVVAKGWDAVLDAIDTVITSPTVDEEAVALAEAEIVAAAESDLGVDELVDEDIETDEDEDAAPVSEDEEEDESDEDAEDDVESFWVSVGVDPVRIITSDNTFYTLRCYLGDDPVFLGRNGAITVFTSERALARYLADDHDHDLAAVSTYEDIRTAAVDGSLEVEVTDENVYVLPGLADDLAKGPESVDAEQLDLAVELFTDAAEYAGDTSVDDALAPSTPLGWYVSYVTDPTAGRMAPSAPFDAEAVAWRALEQEFETRLRKN